MTAQTVRSGFSQDADLPRALAALGAYIAHSGYGICLAVFHWSPRQGGRRASHSYRDATTVDVRPGTGWRNAADGLFPAAPVV